MLEWQNSTVTIQVFLKYSEDVSSYVSPPQNVECFYSIFCLYSDLCIQNMK